MCPPRELDSFRRPGGLGRYAGASASTTEALRLQLATLRWREAVDVAEHRSRCEEVLRQAVELRAERRHLTEQIAQCERDKMRANELSARSTTRWGHTELTLRTELATRRSELDDARGALRQLKVGAVLEDDPELELKEAEERCCGLRRETLEFAEARTASGELAERLRMRLGSLRGHVRLLQGELLDEQHSPRSHDLDGLQHEVNILRAKLRIAEEELGDEAERARLQRAGDKQLPRLRQAEQERKRAQAMLMQARWDRDALQRDFDRVISGLEEQRASQELNARNLRSEVASTKREGEEMVAVMRENDLRMAEMRQDQWEAEGFIQHLHTQLRRLEAERGALRGSLEREARERRHVATLAVQALVEGLPREEEEEGLEEETAGLEARLAAGQAHNAVLRLEVAALEPALESQAALADAER